MFLWLKTLYRKRAVTWPFIFYTIIWTLSRIIITNLIVITIGITTLTNKALISSMILIVFDFIIIYSLLFLIKKVTEYLNR